jgi:hypothetical protein
MNETATNTSSDIGEFLASRGGPFFELQLRLRMLHENALHAGRRAAIFVALSWGAPLLLSLVEGQAFGHKDGHPYLFDYGAWARFFIATGLFLLTEQQVEEGLRAKLDHFVKARIIAPGSLAEAAQAVATALKQRNSPIAEFVCLALAIGAAIGWLFRLLAMDASTWAVDVTDAGARVTLAGWWTVIFSVPLFYFLALRGFWRYAVWAMLLWRLASLELRLVANHPDGKGGLGFIAEYPNAYSMFVFGLSSAVAVPVVHHVFENGVSSVTFGYIITGWLAIVLAAFCFPLLAFAKPLSELKEKSLQILGAQATDYYRQTERALIGRNAVGGDDPQNDPSPIIVDPSAQFAVTRKLSVFVMSRAAVVPVAACALVPFAIAGATKLPYKEVIGLVKKLLVL